MIQFVVSVLLYFVIFFGLSFILTMLLRGTWIMAIVYPIVIMPFVGKNGYFDYITSPKTAFSELWAQIGLLQVLDVIILLSGFLGTIVSGIVIKYLRKSGYQMF